MKGIWVLAVVCAFVAGSLVTGAVVFADPDDDELSSLLCPVGQAITGILFEDDDEILDLICDTGATGPAGATGPIGPAGATGPAGSVGISETTSTIELLPLGSIDGAINPQGGKILFYGDVLCKIEAGGSLYIEFGGDTTVKHLNDCSTRNGNLINLDPAIDTVFHQGDVLVLERVVLNWEQVFLN